MAYQIREARTEDFIQIAEICREDLGYDCALGLVETQLARAIASAADNVWVAEEEGRVIGFSHAANYDTLYFPQMKNLMGLAVRRTERGKGVGSDLLAAAEAWAMQEGSYGVRVNSGMERSLAHQFYRNRGYGREKEQKCWIKEF